MAKHDELYRQSPLRPEITSPRLREQLFLPPLEQDPNGKYIRPNPDVSPRRRDQSQEPTRHLYDILDTNSPIRKRIEEEKRIIKETEKRKEFTTDFYADYDASNKGLAPPLPEPEVSTTTSDVGIASLIPQLDILGDKPVYNTDNSLMDELLKLSKPNKRDQITAILAGMTNPKDKTWSAAVGGGLRSGVAYKEDGKNRYLKAIGLGAVRQDQINKTRYQTDVDWQLANRQMDVDIWSAQTKAGAKGFDPTEWLGDVNKKRMEQLGDELTNPDRIWEPGDRELAEKVYETMRTKLFLELIFKRPLKGGGNISDN